MSEANKETTGLGKGWWASAALMAFVVLGLVLVLVFPRHNESTEPDPTVTDPEGRTSTPVDPSTTAAPSSSSASPGDPKDWEDAGCNGTTGSTEVPTKAPEGVQWTPVGAMSVPTSSEYGPLNVRELPLRRCFQHSPTGALLAAVNIPAAGGATGQSEDAAAVIREQMTPGPARDAGISGAVDGPSQVWSVAGFRIGACERSRCNVDLAMDVNGQLARWTLSMVWADGDWKLDGNQRFGVTAMASVPADFAPWVAGM